MKQAFLIGGVMLVGFISAQNIDLCWPTADIDESYNLYGSFHLNSSRNLSGIDWYLDKKGKTVSCSGDNSDCQRDGLYDGTKMGNESTLMFDEVKKEDAGLVHIEVQYEDKGRLAFNVCDLVVRNKPSCNISTSVQSSDLDLGENVTLALDLKDYYCSKPINMSLTTEKSTLTFLTNENVDDLTGWTFNVSFTMTLERFGNVSMTMVCGDSDLNFRCNGVQSLIMSSPKCNISSSADTDNLHLGENVTLTVAINKYYCPRSTEFVIRTGSDEEMLVTKHIVDNVSDVIKDVDLKVTSNRLGEVSINYTCDDRTLKLNCSGVETLSIKEPMTTPLSTNPHMTSVTESSEELSTSLSDAIPQNNEDINIPLIAGSVAGGLLLIIIIILVILNRRKIQDVAHVYFVAKRQPRIEYMDGEIPEDYLPEMMKDAVAEDDIRLGSLEARKEKDESTNTPMSCKSDLQPYAVSRLSVDFE